MRKQRISELHLTSTASPEALFALLSDAASWPTWFRPARRVVVRDVDGTWTRCVTIGPVTVQEAVLEEQAPTHHAYSIRTVLPVTDHRADVWLHVTPSGTAIIWTSAFRANAIVAKGLTVGVRRLALALIKAAETSSRTAR